MEKIKIKQGKGPDFIKYFIPILEVLKSLGGSGTPSEVIDLIIGVQNKDY